MCIWQRWRVPSPTSARMWRCSFCVRQLTAGQQSFPCKFNDNDDGDGDGDGDSDDAAAAAAVAADADATAAADEKNSDEKIFDEKKIRKFLDENIWRRMMTGDQPKKKKNCIIAIVTLELPYVHTEQKTSWSAGFGIPEQIEEVWLLSRYLSITHAQNLCM